MKNTIIMQWRLKKKSNQNTNSNKSKVTDKSKNINNNRKKDPKKIQGKVKLRKTIKSW